MTTFETGWASLPATPPAHVWYISVTDGNDAHSGLSPATPKRTLRSLHGLPSLGDWVLLDERDTWDETVETWPTLTNFLEHFAGGVCEASSTRPFVISTYGPGNRMAVVRPTSADWPGGGIVTPGLTGMIVRNIHFDGNGGATEIKGIISQGGPIDRVRVEGCRFTNLFGGAHFNSSTSGGDVHVRRCTADRISIDNRSGNAICFYFSKVKPHVTDCPGLDYCGWDPGNGVEGAKRDQQRRAIYCQSDCDAGGELKRLTIFRSSSEAFQARVGDPVVCVVGAECGGAGMLHHGGANPAGDYLMFVANIGSADLEIGGPRGGGLEVSAGSPKIAGLILSGRGAAMGSDCVGLSLKGAGTTTLHKGALIDWQSAGGAGRGVVAYSDTPTVKLLGVDVQATGASAVCVDISSQASGTLHSASDNNRYKSGTAATAFYGPEGSQAFAAWQANRTTAEAHSTYGTVSYPNIGGLLVSKFMEHLGYPAESQNLDGYMAQAAQQRLGYWRPEFTTGALYNWFAACLGWGGCVQDPPAGLAAAVSQGGGVDLSWTAIGGLMDVTPAGLTYGVAHYNVYKSSDGGATWALLGDAESASSSDNAGVAGDRYAVTAVDTEGFETQPSAAVAAAVAVVGPFVASATITLPGTMRIVWNEAVTQDGLIAAIFWNAGVSNSPLTYVSGSGTTTLVCSIDDPTGLDSGDTVVLQVDGACVLSVNGSVQNSGTSDFPVTFAAGTGGGGSGGGGRPGRGRGRGRGR